MTRLEEMSDFFAARLEGYDQHMLMNVEGCREGYARMAELLPTRCEHLLDLGCGTGLELDHIFMRFPALSVTGIDLTEAMLGELRRKHPQKDLTLVCGDYFEVPFGIACFDAAVSFETLHHFSHDKKHALYQKICAALGPEGCYIECDYMAETQAEEDHFFAEYARLCREQGRATDAYFHYDTPCTVENQIRLLHEAGFAHVTKEMHIGGTVLLMARK